MLMNELVIREVSDSLRALSTTQKTQQKGIIYEPESQPSLDADPTSASVLVFPDSRTARNKFLLFIGYLVYGSPNALRYLILESSPAPGPFMSPCFSETV